MRGVYLLLGTNLGDKMANIQKAKKCLEAKEILIVNESSIYETAAWGIEEQPSFYNQVIEVDQPYSPQRLLKLALEIEHLMGRQRLVKWGERLIDIDILYFGHKVIETKDLHVPHQEIPHRRFTLDPLVEICPDYIHPTLSLTNRQLLDHCSDQLPVEKLNF